MGKTKTYSSLNTHIVLITQFPTTQIIFSFKQKFPSVEEGGGVHCGHVTALPLGFDVLVVALLPVEGITE